MVVQGQAVAVAVAVAVVRARALDMSVLKVRDAVLPVPRSIVADIAIHLVVLRADILVDLRVADSFEKVSALRIPL